MTVAATSVYRTIDMERVVYCRVCETVTGMTLRTISQLFSADEIVMILREKLSNVMTLAALEVARG